MKKRMIFFLSLLVALLWFATRQEDRLSDGEREATRESGGGAPIIRRIEIQPEAPSLKSVLRVEVEADPPALPAGEEWSYRYRWFVNKKEVSQEASLFLGKFRQGDLVAVEVTSLNAGPDSSGSPPATASVKIGNNPPLIKAIRFSPMPVSAGEAVRAEIVAEDPDRDLISFSYEWRINGQSILGNNRDRLEGDRVRSADKITVSVTPSDPFSNGIPQLSPLLTVLNRPPEILSHPSLRQEKEVYTYPVMAKDPDGDSLHYLILKGPAGMQIDPASGLLNWKSVPLTGNQADVVIEVNDAKGGRAVQQFTVQILPPPQ